MPNASPGKFPMPGSEDDLKAAAILAGFLSEFVSGSGKESVFREAAWEFASLLSALTAMNAGTRDLAKRRIRELAKSGGWSNDKQQPQCAKPKAIFPLDDKTKTTRPRKAGGTWSKDETEMTRQQWLSSSRDQISIKAIANTTGRSEFAIIIRLYRLGLMTLHHGDALCRELQTAKLLSEVDPAN